MVKCWSKKRRTLPIETFAPSTRRLHLVLLTLRPCPNWDCLSPRSSTSNDTCVQSVVNERISSGLFMYSISLSLSVPLEQERILMPFRSTLQNLTRMRNSKSSNYRTKRPKKPSRRTGSNARSTRNRPLDMIRNTAANATCVSFVRTIHVTFNSTPKCIMKKSSNRHRSIPLHIRRRRPCPNQWSPLNWFPLHSYPSWVRVSRVLLEVWRCWMQHWTRPSTRIASVKFSIQ